jgi:hypothetical protein
MIGGPRPSSSVLTATISLPIASVQPIGSTGGSFVSVGCSKSSEFTEAFDIAMTASSAVDIDQITLHLIDGTNLGGPEITFPQPNLVSQFGTTHIAAGVSRTFTFHPQFGCASPSLRSVTADIRFLDMSGLSHGITVTTPVS